MSELVSPATSASGLDHSEERTGVRDFDFLHGRWLVHNRRRPRSATCPTEWEEFEGRSVVRAFWDGAGNMEEWEASPRGGIIRSRRGEFFAQEDIAGRSTLLRNTWEELSAYECRWEQSFSHDGGRSWQLDWTMAFTRE